jgi:hypothetical protein
MTETADGKALMMYSNLGFLDIAPLTSTFGYTQFDLKTRQIDYSIFFNGTYNLDGQYLVPSDNGSYWGSAQDE